VVVWRIRDGRPLARLGLHVEMGGEIPASFRGTSGATIRAAHRCVCLCFSSWPQRGSFLVAILAPENGNVRNSTGSLAVSDRQQEYKVVLYDWQGSDSKLSLSNGMVGYEGAGIDSIVACCDSPIDHSDRDIVTRYASAAFIRLFQRWSCRNNWFQILSVLYYAPANWKFRPPPAFRVSPSQATRVLICNPNSGRFITVGLSHVRFWTGIIADPEHSR
jgi:hypothetical protein